MLSINGSTRLTFAAGINSLIPLYQSSIFSVKLPYFSSTALREYSPIYATGPSDIVNLLISSNLSYHNLNLDTGYNRTPGVSLRSFTSSSLIFSNSILYVLLYWYPYISSYDELLKSTITSTSPLAQFATLVPWDNICARSIVEFLGMFLTL